jgi:hypothetical protein
LCAFGGERTSASDSGAASLGLVSRIVPDHNCGTKARNGPRACDDIVNIDGWHAR